MQVYLRYPKPDVHVPSRQMFAYAIVRQVSTIAVHAGISSCAIALKAPSANDFYLSVSQEGLCLFRSKISKFITLFVTVADYQL